MLADVCGHTSGTATYWLGTEQIDRALDSLAPFLHEEESKHPNIAALKAVRNPALAAGGKRVAVAAFSAR